MVTSARVIIVSSPWLLTAGACHLTTPVYLCRTHCRRTWPASSQGPSTQSPINTRQCHHTAEYSYQMIKARHKYNQHDIVSPDTSIEKKEKLSPRDHVLVAHYTGG